MEEHMYLENPPRAFNSKACQVPMFPYVLPGMQVQKLTFCLELVISGVGGILYLA